MEPRDGFVEANGIRIHYLEWGREGLPPAVLLHATGFLARLWQPVAEALSDRFHVYACDSRGHGDSDKPPGDYHWRHFAQDLRAFLDALGLRQVVAVGHSAGGAAAAYVAAARPGYISRLVLIEPIIFPPQAQGPRDDRRQALASGARRRRMVWDSAAEIVRTYRKRPTFARWREDVLRLYAEHGTFRRPDGRLQLKCPGEIEARIFENSGWPDVWDRLPRISCPTLVLRGEHTDVYLFQGAAAVAGRIPGARLATVRDAGHLLPMERPEAVTQELLAFLQGVAPP